MALNAAVLGAGASWPASCAARRRAGRLAAGELACSRKRSALAGRGALREQLGELAGAADQRGDLAGREAPDGAEVNAAARGEVSGAGEHADQRERP